MNFDRSFQSLGYRFLFSGLIGTGLSFTIIGTLATSSGPGLLQDSIGTFNLLESPHCAAEEEELAAQSPIAVVRLRLVPLCDHRSMLGQELSVTAFGICNDLLRLIDC